VEGEIATIGITNHAADAFGDIVFIELPEIGRKFQKGDSFATVESVKAASDVYAPVAGQVDEVNVKIGDTPNLVNESAEVSGWLIKLAVSDKTQLNELLTKDLYEKWIKEEK